MDLMRALDRFKDERDWLVHRSQHSYGDRLYTEVGRSEMLLRLDAFTEEARRLQKAVLQEINTFVASAGIDIEAAEDMARKNMGRLRGMPYGRLVLAAIAPDRRRKTIGAVKQCRHA